MPPKRKDDHEQRTLTRIAVVNTDRCKPKKCNLECKKCCPINLQGKQCIEVAATSVLSYISEELCIGCALCEKRCPYKAISIINLPSNLSKDTTHRFGPNGFKLHRLPLPRAGQVLGLVGANGTGKTSALRILEGKLIPNLGKVYAEPSWPDILKYFRGSEHQAYFQQLVEGKLKAIVKPQFVDQVPKAVSGPVYDILKRKDERQLLSHYIDKLDLQSILENDVEKLSGGELQRFTLAIACLQQSTIYMFDEPSSYLDVRQRIAACHVIRDLLGPDRFVIVVEHDLSVMDYIADYVCVLYGRANLYGVVTLPYGVREGINVFLEGFIPSENLRFRPEPLDFHASVEEVNVKKAATHVYPSMSKTLGGKFHLKIEEGSFSDSEIVVLLGENGCGKTTFIRMLAGFEKPDDGVQMPSLSVSYKPQKISPKFQGSVKDLLQTKINDALNHPQFASDVLRPLNMEELYDVEVQHLSGGQRQRVAITIALGIPANVYLLDEPSAYLDAEQRVVAAKVIKKFIMHTKKAAFIVEHDMIMATYLADRVVVYEGIPAVQATARTPSTLLDGMNKFLKHLDVSIRNDPYNFRPRVNKKDSVKDRHQKEKGEYFYMREPVVDPKTQKLVVEDSEEDED